MYSSNNRRRCIAVTIVAGIAVTIVAGIAVTNVAYAMYSSNIRRILVCILLS